MQVSKSRDSKKRLLLIIFKCNFMLDHMTIKYLLTCFFIEPDGLVEHQVFEWTCQILHFFWELANFLETSVLLWPVDKLYLKVKVTFKIAHNKDKQLVAGRFFQYFQNRAQKWLQKCQRSSQTSGQVAISPIFRQLEGYTVIKTDHVLQWGFGLG